MALSKVTNYKVRVQYATTASPPVRAAVDIFIQTSTTYATPEAAIDVLLEDIYADPTAIGLPSGTQLASCEAVSLANQGIAFALS